jgi:hypothetical protein
MLWSIAEHMAMTRGAFAGYRQINTSSESKSATHWRKHEERAMPDSVKEAWLSDVAWLAIATRFDVPGHGPLSQVEGYPIHIERTEGPYGTKWAVRRLDRCLNHEFEWEWEPQPSSRDDEFFARCRFECKEEALYAAQMVSEPPRAALQSPATPSGIPSGTQGGHS